MASVSLYEIANGLDKVRWHGDKKFSARCLAHDDRTPSFSAQELNGRILVHCFSGCSQSAVIDALRGRGLWHSPSSSNVPHTKRISQDEIRHHQFVVALGLGQVEQGIALTEDDKVTMQKSVRFLNGCGYE
jgi:hypothetical protein